MAILSNQKTFLQVQQQLSELVLKTTYPNVAADAVTQPGLTRLKQIINDAYAEITSEVDWRWRFIDTYTFPTVAGQQTPYVMPDDCEDLLWVTIPFFQQRLWATEYSQWLTNYPGGYTNYANAKPWSYIQAPDAANNEMQIYLFPAADAPVPAGAYTVKIGYMRRVTPLVLDADVMVCPPEFQDLVINRAILKTYQFLGDPKWQTYDDSPESDTFAARRYSAMWVKNQVFAEAVSYWRDIRTERAFTASLDINRVLFSYGG